MVHASHVFICAVPATSVSAVFVRTSRYQALCIMGILDTGVLEYVRVKADVGYECFCGVEFKLVETRLQNSAVIGQFTVLVST